MQYLFTGMWIDHSFILISNSEQVWKGVLFGVHWNSKGVLHATIRVVTSAGCFVDNHGSKNLWTYSKGITKATILHKAIVAIMWSNVIVVSQQWPRLQLLQQCIPTTASVPTVESVYNKGMCSHCWVTVKMAVFWAVAPCSLIALMMEAARTSETLVNFYQTTRLYNPEDSHLRPHRRENLKSYIE
jgi:hypothetical protein